MTVLAADCGGGGEEVIPTTEKAWSFLTHSGAKQRVENKTKLLNGHFILFQKHLQ